MDAPHATSSSSASAADSTYVHRTGTREFLACRVMPHVQQALEDLLLETGKQRLKLAADADLEDGQYLPHGWRPFCAHRWLAEYLIAHKPISAPPPLEAANKMQ